MDNITIVVVNRKCRLGHIRERRFAITPHISTAMAQSIYSYIYNSARGLSLKRLLRGSFQRAHARRRPRV